MDNKADVKAMMALFQAGGSSKDAAPPAGRAKQPLHPTLSSGPTLQTRKPVLDGPSGNAVITPPKPGFLKNAAAAKNDNVVHELNKSKALADRFATAQDDTKTSINPLFGNKQQIPMKPSPSKPPEAKGPVLKPPLNKPPPSSTLSDSQLKIPGALTSKPSWVKDNSGGGVPPAASSPAKIPPLQPKPSSSLIKLWQQNEERTGTNADAANKPPPQATPPSNFRTAQKMFNNEKDNSEQPENGGTGKAPLSVANSALPPKPSASKKPSLKRPPKDAHQPGPHGADAAAAGPKRNPLLNSLALGSPPAKPNRPPCVNLESFKRGAAAAASEDGPGTYRKSFGPTPQSFLLSNHSNHVIPPPVPQADLPSLPPRHPGCMMPQEDFYDDVDGVNNSPPPLPPPSGHPSQWAKEEIDDDDEDMYDDLDDRWDEAEQKQEKQKEKEAKEAKKRLEAEKKEQREREKKEQDTRKKFKLVGPLEVIQQGKACVDCRGTKTDLGLKQGDHLDILRVQGNPEGKWLGRAQDGSIGYVKTTSVEIDFNSLKSCHSEQEYDPEVYDDIDVVSADTSGIKGPAVELPPLPGEEGEIYDDVVDLNLQVSPPAPSASITKSRSFLRMFERNSRPASAKELPPPSQFTAQGIPDQTEDEEIYDDVDPQNQLPPLPVSRSSDTNLKRHDYRRRQSPPVYHLRYIFHASFFWFLFVIFSFFFSSFPKGKGRTEEMDPKKQKKFEKEEKDFRKKFKYDGEIQVLHQVTIVHTLTNKKWFGKELPVKPREQLDVIVDAVDNKLICRNEEGKFGYVSTSHVVMDDSDIYDDIGDDCIYDND